MIGAPCSNPAGAARRGDAGFTLVELLVGLLIVGLIVGLLFGSLRFGSRVWETVQQRGDDIARIEIAQNFIRTYLGKARLLPGGSGGSSGSLAFEGDAGSVSFVTTLPLHLGDGGLYLMRIHLDEQPDGRALAVSWRSYRAGEEAASDDDERTTILIEGVSSANFDYFGALRTADPPDWRDYWEPTGSIPALVRLRISLADDAAMWWPDLVVATMLGREAGVR
jgi:general secretion pathway protein J